eukprot:TRINITY_DN28750_c0_g1_i2.p2 TRINITY_DN28750_c0_g1~~TRINITY_DN28750_c0_g1_i2.p2  ORF type:complete len:126 (-),score=50.92 TRINITY_DN28750_c0_g1_i2:15-392(-)
MSFFFFFFNDTATTEIYTRSIVGSVRCVQETGIINEKEALEVIRKAYTNYKQLINGEKRGLSLIHISEPTRPLYISYAVFCLKKKKKKNKHKQSHQYEPSHDQQEQKHIHKKKTATTAQEQSTSV